LSKQTRKRHLSLAEQIINQTTRRNEYLAKIECDSNPIVVRNRFTEEVIFADDIISEARALHDDFDEDSMLDYEVNFKGTIFLPIEENNIQITSPPTIRLNHEMNFWIVIERINTMGANVHIEELYFIEVLDCIMN